nr:MAG TPA: hypothetical protein [Caudoviricetes sp.]DAK55517.1 MAG TPA: hypothetical protein [Caudoviricetes sp.]
MNRKGNSRKNPLLRYSLILCENTSCLLTRAN